jgi:protrudin
MAGRGLAAKFGHLANENLDIQELVDAAHILLRLLQPLALFFQFACQLIRWERPWICTGLLVFCNVFCIFLPSVYLTMGIILSVGILAALGLSHRRYRLLVKILPSTEYVQDELSRADENVTSHHERIQNFRLLLIAFHAGLKRAAALLDSFYSLLKWDDVRSSANCCAILCCTILLLRAMPLRFNVLLFIDVILLSLPISHRLQNWKQKRQRSIVEAMPLLQSMCTQKVTDIKMESVADDAISMGSDIQVDAGIGSESDISDSENTKPGDESSSGDEAEGVVSSSDQPLRDGRVPNTTTVRAPGVVGRILELKKRHQQPNEKCTGCHVIFTTILKRRHICSHCGNHFCSRCCSHKVPRSTFGATAPAAQTETVAVCYRCFSVLTSAAATKAKAS